MKEQTCIHQKLCKHCQEDDMSYCGIREVCKYFTQSFLGGGVDMDGLRIEQPKRKAVKETVDDLLAVFRKAKVYISLHKDKLNDNQSKAMASLSGKHYSGLTKEQKDQVVAIAADLERTVKGIKERKD